MSNKVFQQNLDDKKGPQPGGPYLIQMLFKEPADMPDQDEMTAVMEKHIGAVECFCRDKKMAGYAALDHIAEFQDGKCPVQLMVMKCDKFKGKGFDCLLYTSAQPRMVSSSACHASWFSFSSSFRSPPKVAIIV